jgi:hypothetical protein
MLGKALILGGVRNAAVASLGYRLTAIQKILFELTPLRNFSYPQTLYEIPNPTPKKETLMTLRVI